jgi:hypothetical protein
VAAEYNKFDNVHSIKIRAGNRRTYFFDVKQTKGEDYYLSITESTRKFNSDGMERHKIFIYKEDFNKFMKSLQDSVDHIKGLMPDYDFEEFDRRNAEWERKKALEIAEAENNSDNDDSATTSDSTESTESTPTNESTSDDVSADDMNW